MHDIDNDTDGFYRKAAEDYPLLLPRDGWNAVAERLLNNSRVILPAAQTNKRRNKNRWFFFLLLPGSFFIVGALLFSTLNSKKIAGSLPVNLLQPIDIEQQNAAPAINNASIEKIAVQPVYQDIITQKKLHGIFIETGDAKTITPGNETQTTWHNQTPIFLAVATIPVLPTIESPAEPGNVLPVNSAAEIAMQQGFSTNDRQNNIDIPKSDTEIKSVIPAKIKTPLKNRFYAGILAGPQFNQVKNQGLGKAGFNGGIIAGMHFSKRWSVETGLLATEKKYSSSGAYFKMDKVAASMPTGMKVETMNGKSTVLEIPVQLKYNIIQNNKKQVFVSGGISSYLLTTENNNYHASVNGNPENLAGHYSNNKKYAGAVVNLGAGYQWKAGKKTTLRIAPYMQIPLKGIGIGSLPVFSTGVHLGISIPVHR
jgi:Outer membrane protein beta-barrel domain